MRNLRVAETEKYAHVTYFFNGGVEQPFPGEDRLVVPSQKVATYDLKPEMSAAGIAETVIKATNDGTFDVMIVNFANADMVGHSGKIEPTIKAVETVDACLGEIEKAVRAKGGAMLITADHGNAEMMIDPVTGGPHTAHTTNPVPFIVLADDAKQYTLKPNGSLRDISPTILGMLGIDEPKEMTGRGSSREKDRDRRADAKTPDFRPPSRLTCGMLRRGLRTVCASNFLQVDVVHLPDYKRVDAEILDAEIAVTWSVRPEQIKAAKKLRWIHSPAAAVHQLIFPEIVESDIVLTNARDVHGPVVAEHVIALIFALAKKIPDAVRLPAERMSGASRDLVG